MRLVSMILIGVCLTAVPVFAQDEPDWRRVTEQAAWRPRDSQGEIVYRDKMWILGGWINSSTHALRDVWASSDGSHWELVTEIAPWKSADLPMVVAFNNNMWLMGGWRDGRLPGATASNEVWCSTDGATWTQVTEHAGWSPRLGAAIVEFHGKMWIFGGTEQYYYGDKTSLKNDIWSSSDGKHWKLEATNASWSPRAYHQTVVLNKKIYLLGGGNYSPDYQARNDVWSSEDGVHWQLATAAAPWAERIWFSSVAYRDRMWVLGGWSNYPSKNWNDVWHSPDGKNWTQVKTDTVWKERHEHSAFVLHDKIWVAGGMVWPLVNDVWSLEMQSEEPAARTEETLSTETGGPARRLHADKLLVYLDEMGKLQEVRSTEDWLKRREQIVQAMQTIMGTLPGNDKRCALDVKVHEETDCGNYVRQAISYASEPNCRVPAYLLIPRSIRDGATQKAPAALCLHSTNRVVGCGEVVGLGRPSKPNLQYANELADQGYVVLAPNYPLLAKYQPDLKALGWESGTLKAVWDNIRGVDLLQSLPYVMPEKVAVIGHSLGGHNAVFTAVFDKRLKVVVSSCGFDSFVDYGHDDPTEWLPEHGWTQSRYMPKLAKYRGRVEQIPFDFHEVIAALAPRPVLIIAPLHDDFNPSSVDRIAATAGKVYKLYGHSERLSVKHPDCKHDFPLEMRKAAYEFIDAALR